MTARAVSSSVCELPAGWTLRQPDAVVGNHPLLQAQVEDEATVSSQGARMVGAKVDLRGATFSDCYLDGSGHRHRGGSGIGISDICDHKAADAPQ
jgi:hypothetical protein